MVLQLHSKLRVVPLVLLIQLFVPLKLVVPPKLPTPINRPLAPLRVLLVQKQPLPVILDMLEQLHSKLRVVPLVLLIQLLVPLKIVHLLKLPIQINRLTTPLPVPLVVHLSLSLVMQDTKQVVQQKLPLVTRIL